MLAACSLSPSHSHLSASNPESGPTRSPKPISYPRPSRLAKASFPLPSRPRWKQSTPTSRRAPPPPSSGRARLDAGRGTRDEGEGGGDLSPAADMDLDADAQRAAVRTRSHLLPAHRFPAARSRASCAIACRLGPRRRRADGNGCWLTVVSVLGAVRSFLRRVLVEFRVRAGPRVRRGGCVLCSGSWLGRG
jgi:hypothetical protein